MRWAYAVARVPRTLTAMMFATMLTTVLARLTLWVFATAHALQMPMVTAFAIHRLLRAPLISSRFRLDRQRMRCI